MTRSSVTGSGVTPVRIGLAGYRRGGRYFHAPLIGLVPECVLAAVVATTGGGELRDFGSHLTDQALHGAPGPRFRVTGATGTFAVKPDDGQSERLLSGQNPGDDAFGTVPQARWGRIYRGENVSAEPVPAERGRWSSFYSAFARAVRHEDPLPMDPRDAVAALDVLDAVRASATGGEVVRLSQVPMAARATASSAASDATSR